MESETRASRGKRFRLLPVFWFQEHIPSNYLVRITAPIGMQVTAIPEGKEAYITRVSMIISNHIRQGNFVLEIWKNNRATEYTRTVDGSDQISIVWNIPYGELAVTRGDEVGISLASDKELAPRVSIDLIMYACSEVD